jgi:hypothetical protein
MFVRAKRSVSTNGQAHQYLQIVRSVREGTKVRQKVIGTLGRRDELVASGQLDGLLRSLAVFSEKLTVVEQARTSGLRARTAKAWGAPLVFQRLWERQGLPDVISRLAKERRFQFDIERCIFAMALQRLMAPGSDLQAASWIGTVEAEGFDALSLQHFYRSAQFLHDVRASLEQQLFERDRDLFSQSLDVVFIDTTSTYVYRDTSTPWRTWGYSRDRRGDLPQLVICVVVDAAGWPVAWEVFPGNTADKPAFNKVIAILRERLQVRRTIVVADRGMISKDTLKLLTEHETAPFEYVLGCRMRQQKEVTGLVLASQGPLELVAPNLHVKEVLVEGRRYVVCRNEFEVQKDIAARAAVVEKLRETLSKSGPKAVVGNKGFARFLRVEKGAVSINDEAVASDARFDGTFVLTTNTKLCAAEVATTYKSLWRVERAFRTEKSVLDVRPIYHHTDRNSIGHIVACFLALRLEVDLQHRLDENQITASWPDLMRDLAQVQAVEVEADGKRYRLRTDLQGHAQAAFAAAGVRPPSIATLLGPVEPPPDGGREPEM